jgi:hypothetical protein
MTNTAQPNINALVGGLLIIGAVVTGLIGVVWVVTYYMSQGTLPIPALGSWNLLLGGLLFLAGIPMLVIGIVLIVRRRHTPVALPVVAQNA